MSRSFKGWGSIASAIGWAPDRCQAICLANVDQDLCRLVLIWCNKLHVFLNSSPPHATLMHQWTGSALIQVMAYRLFGAKPLPEPVLTYCELDP